MDLSPLRIGIVGAGFSGTALSAIFHRLADRPIEIFLFEKEGHFGQGDAYSTPYPFHLLNVRTIDMSAFEDEPDHFVNWLISNQSTHPYFDTNKNLHTQFAPRLLYGKYLKHLLDTIQADSSRVKLTLIHEEVIDVTHDGDQAKLTLKNQKLISVDKVILAIGNNPPTTFPFSVSSNVNCIHNSWDYAAVKQIAAHEPVLIVGTGLSMIDAVLTLYHQQHQGKIYAVSRHGLLPLPHADVNNTYEQEKPLSAELRILTNYLRTQSKLHIEKGGDWREVVNAIRHHVPLLWTKLNSSDRKRFLRHVLPYWNIHRHRVHTKLIDLLSELISSQQLTIISGRIQSADDKITKIKLRHSNDSLEVEVKWLINCMGPALSMGANSQPLVRSLLHHGFAKMDSLELGFDISHEGALYKKSDQVLDWLYTLGPPAKSAFWECSAVPEIRKHSLNLARHILNIDK